MTAIDTITDLIRERGADISRADLAEIERLAVADAPFLDARFDPAKARALWAACYEAVIEIADSERALDGMRREEITAASLTATRDLRDRIAVLQPQISNLEFWRAQ